MNSRGIRKVFIDSRYSTDGKTFELHNAGIVLNPDSRMWLSEFTCTASWDTIDDTNNKLAIADGIGSWRRVITIPSGARDLQSFREALEAALSTTGWGAYTVSLVSTGSSGSTYRSFLIENPNGFSQTIQRALCPRSFRFPTGHPRRPRANPPLSTFAGPTRFT